MPENMNMLAPEPLSGNNSEAAHREFITFMLGKEEYGIDILQVQEIRGYDHVTRVPGIPKFIKGLTNLRGSIVPIIDMRVKFLLDDPSYDHLTTVIILNINERLLGMVVSSVSDVIKLNPSQIQTVSGSRFNLKSEYLIGLGSFEQRMIILINAEKLITSEDMALVDNTGSTFNNTQ